MRFSPLKFSFVTSLLVHGTIFTAYALWHGSLNHEGFAETETAMTEIVIELEHASDVSESTPAEATPPPAVEPDEKITAPADISSPSPMAEMADDSFPVTELVAFAAAPLPVQPVQSETPSLHESVPASDVPAKASSAIVDGQAGYLICPKPAYPREARRRKQQGLVVLHVSISVEGFPEDVLIRQSSGVRTLDDAALDAVKRWQFVPALANSRTVTSQVEIPIRFRLSN